MTKEFAPVQQIIHYTLDVLHRMITKDQGTGRGKDG